MKAFSLATVLCTVIALTNACCFFNGVSYDDGQTLTRTCFKYRCVEDQWVFAGFNSELCGRGMCRGINGHTIETYDKLYTAIPDHYNLDEHCSYSFTQLWQLGTPAADTYNPGSAIYVELENCAAGSCFDNTTYIYGDLRVVIDHSNLPHISVNGIALTLTSTPQLLSITIGTTPFIQPVFAHAPWPSLIILTGPIFSLIMTSTVVYAFVPHLYMRRVNGLCGYFDDNWINDQTGRFDTVLDASWAMFPVGFIHSWLTLEQDECEPIGMSASMVPSSKCRFTLTASADCSNALSFLSEESSFKEPLIQSCIMNICKDPEQKSFWLSNAVSLAKDVQSTLPYIEGSSLVKE